LKLCPALLVSAPASGQGKTTLTAALARLHRNQGQNVHVFKCGPDFLDPMILQRASGNPVYQLDLWMGGQSHCQQLLYQAASVADLILIEGVMGLYDGEPSSADLAILFNIPVVAVIDASAMAETFGAVAQELATYRKGLSLAGVFANRVAGSTHIEMLRTSLPANLAWLGALSHHDSVSLHSRHLGLVQANEIDDLDLRLDKLAEKLSNNPISELPPAVAFTLPDKFVDSISPTLAGVRIAVAADTAFSFVYHANLNLLQTLGAQLIFFSPLNDASIPGVDSLY
jgi:cobyrinic acid a,c-diamide synthase